MAGHLAIFVAAALIPLGALIATTLFPAICERAWLFAANAVTFGWYGRQQRPQQRPCVHRGAVPVQGLHGETVAHLCADCDEQLPAEWKISVTDLFFDPHLIDRR